MNEDIVVFTFTLLWITDREIYLRTILSVQAIKSYILIVRGIMKNVANGIISSCKQKCTLFDLALEGTLIT